MTISKLTPNTEIFDTKFPQNKSKNDPTALTNDNDGIKRYDFQNISRTEFRTIINDLITTGQMSLDESSSLVMAMESGNIGEVPTQNSEQKVNVFELLKQSMDFNQYIGNISGIEYDTKAFNALMRFQDKSFGVDMTV